MDPEEQDLQTVSAKIVFCAIALGALWPPLRLLHFLVCPNRVLQWGSQKRPKHFKINGLGRFWGTLLGRPIWTRRTKNTFPCSAALVLHFPEAVPCSAALPFGFLMFSWVAQHGPARASAILINPLQCCRVCKESKKDGAPEADAKD